MPPPPMAVHSSVPNLGMPERSLFTNPPEGPLSAPWPMSEATSAPFPGWRAQHTVEVGVPEPATRIERSPHLLELVPAGVAGCQGLVALEVHLSPMWPPAVLVHDPLDPGEVGVVRSTSVHVDRY